jgi:hypothetical protein
VHRHAIQAVTAPKPALRRTGIAPEHADIGVLPGTGVLPAVQDAVQRTVQQPAAPLSIALAVLLFLLVQHRIDRRDPKLRVPSQAPYDVLEFGSAVRPA